MDTNFDTKKADSKYIANTYARYDFVAESGSGSEVRNPEGKRYIDLSSGIGVNVFGVADEIWKSAVIEQLEKLQHISNHFYSEPQSELAGALCERTGMSKVFFGNSGAEANECAIKAARKYSDDKYGGGRHTIITLVNSFHGRTLATLSATGQSSMHVSFGPFVEGFKYVPANDIDALIAAADGTVCAVMLELIQGEGGVLPLEREYIDAVAELCAERDILMVLDEIQTGMGRTGSLFAFEQFGLTPDIVTVAKGLAGGLPIGACLLGAKLENTLSTGTHGSTFGGNPVCCAAAVSVLSRIDDDLLAQVREKGDLIRSELAGADGVLSVTGMSMMVGIATPFDSREVATKCLERGVIVLTAKDKVRLLPPLNIPVEELVEALKVLKDVLADA